MTNTPRRIAVLGANGRTGRAFVAAALSRCHSVHAGIYHAHDTAFLEHSELTVVECDATDPSQVGILIDSQDVVVSLIGHIKGSDAAVQTDAMRVVEQAMHDHGISRIVSLTGTGVRQPGDRVTPLDHVLNAAIRAVDPARVSDGIAHAEVLKQSGLDWTILRVLKLQNIPVRPFALLPHGPTKPYVGREEVALAILQVIEDDSFVHEMPIIGPMR